jgi:hypothetical protein
LKAKLRRSIAGQHWSQTDVGLVTTCSGLLGGIALRTPAAAAAAAFLVFFGLMPETLDPHASVRDSEPLAIEGALGE